MRISDWSSDVCSSDLIGLLARRTARRPDPQAPAAGYRAGADFLQRRTAEMLEMMVLAEELGQVCGQRIQRRAEFLAAGIGADELDILAETLHSQPAQALGQAGIDHIVLGRAKLDAGATLQHGAQEDTEIGR